MLVEDREDAVRLSSVKSLALIVAIMSDLDKYPQVSTLNSIIHEVYFQAMFVSYFSSVNSAAHLIKTPSVNHKREEVKKSNECKLRPEYYSEK